MPAAAMRLPALAAAFFAAGCSVIDQFPGTAPASVPGALGAPETYTTAAASAAAGAAGAAVDMAGRWTLAAPGRGQCAMIFAGSPGAREGAIAPEGGCPGKFFTSRKWDFEAVGLVIRDHNGEPLAQLTGAGGTQFDGKASTGEPVTLTR
jgi:hypothetical protein